MGDEDELIFKGWPKTIRYNKEQVIVTEKMDGTNGCIVVHNGQVVGVQSRNKFITPDADNFGFAQWVHDHRNELVEFLGEGYHYGEWCGEGIQKNPHKLIGKHFYLFKPREGLTEDHPCRSVRVLWEGPLEQLNTQTIMEDLYDYSQENLYTAEGIIIFTKEGQKLYKLTFANSEGKWASALK